MGAIRIIFALSCETSINTFPIKQNGEGTSSEGALQYGSGFQDMHVAICVVRLDAIISKLNWQKRIISFFKYQGL